MGRFPPYKRVKRETQSEFRPCDFIHMLCEHVTPPAPDPGHAKF